MKIFLTFFKNRFDFKNFFYIFAMLEMLNVFSCF